MVSFGIVGVSSLHDIIRLGLIELVLLLLASEDSSVQFDDSDRFAFRRLLPLKGNMPPPLGIIVGGGLYGVSWDN